MKTLAPVHRRAVNQAAHAAALRFEIETRDRWIQELTQALEAGASFEKLQQLRSSMAFHAAAAESASLLVIGKPPSCDECIDGHYHASSSAHCDLFPSATDCQVS